MCCNKKRSIVLLCLLLFSAAAVAALYGCGASGQEGADSSAGAPGGAGLMEQAALSLSSYEYVPDPIDMDCGERLLFIGRSVGLSEIVSCADAETLSKASVTIEQPDVAAVSGTDIVALSVGDTAIQAVMENGDTYRFALESRKAAYLTFDDFPNSYTPAILDTLRDKNAVATFFLCHQGKEEYHYLYQRIKDEGHAFGNHTGSHLVNKIFKTSGDLVNSFGRMESFYDTMDIHTKLLRMPNGTGDPSYRDVRVNAVRKLKKMGYTWVDWTASTDDCYTVKPEALLNNLKKTCTDDREIVLMHNLHATSLYLGDLIDWMREEGYEFERLDDAPQVYCFMYGWYDNINRRGAGLYTSETLTGYDFSC